MTPSLVGDEGVDAFYLVALASRVEASREDFMSVGARCRAMQANRTYKVKVLRQLSVG